MVLKMRLANICGSDLHYWRGDADLVGRGFEMPYALGHEGVGEIFRLGTGVTTDSSGQPVREGDRVVFRYFDPCGRCAVCLRDHPYACPYRQRQRLRGVRHWPHFAAPLRSTTTYIRATPCSGFPPPCPTPPWPA